MKINLTKALWSLFFTGFVVIQLQASGPSSSSRVDLLALQSQNNKNDQTQIDNIAIKKIAKNMVHESIVKGVASVAHADQLQLLDKLDYHAGQIIGATRLIQSTQSIQHPLWVKYIPVYDNGQIKYASSGQSLVQYDPYVDYYIDQCARVVNENYEHITKEVTTKRSFLGHGKSAIALFEGVHDKLNRSVNASHDEYIKQACQEYQAVADIQKKWIHSQVEKQIVQKNAAYCLMRKQEKKTRHAAKIAQDQIIAQEQKTQERIHADQKLKEFAIENKQEKLAVRLVQEHKVAQENKTCMIDQLIESKFENKLQETKENKIDIKSVQVKNKKEKDIKSLELFMTRADALINTGDSLASVERCLHYAQNTLTAVFLDEADRALLHINTIEPMQQHLNELKNTKNHGVAFKKAKNKLEFESNQLIGCLGYRARQKWEILTGNAQESK